MIEITLGSLFDGIGVWQLAAVSNGITPIWSSEIEDYPMQVTLQHFPDTEQLGDITKVDGSKIKPVDIICAGSPCQDLSVAGKRAGLKGERSGLFSESIRIIREMRESTNGEYPKWFVWENVTGAYSSNKGHDFRTVLEEITESEIPMPDSGRWARGGMVRSPKCDVAWRTLDAQYWGVPQRRARIFLVADFREERRPEVLFEPESVRWNLEKSKSKGEDSSRGIGESANTASWGFEPGATSRVGGKLTKDKTPTIRANMGDNQTSVVYSTDSATEGFNISPYDSGSMKSSNPYNGIKACETARTIDTNGGNPACNQGGTVLVKCIGNGQVDQLNLSDKVGALNCMHDQQGIIQGIATQSYSELRLSDKAATLMAKDGVCGGQRELRPAKNIQQTDRSIMRS